MEKWEHEMKKHVNIHLPEHIDQRITYTIQQIPRHSRKYSKLRIGSAAAAVCVALTLGTVTSSPALASAFKNLPLIGSVFQMVGDFGEKKGSQSGLASMLGQQIKTEYGLITFTEYLYDGSSVHLAFTLEQEGENRKDPLAFMNDFSFSINGERLQNYGTDASGKQLDNKTFIGTIDISTSQKIPDSYELGILSSDGKQTLATLSLKQTGHNTSFLVNKTKTWNGTKLTYDKISFYPTATKIDVHLINKEAQLLKNLEFHVYDEQGNVLRPMRSSGTGSIVDTLSQQEDSYFFEPMNSVPKSLIIKPYMGILESSLSEKIVKGQWKGNAFRLSQGEVGSLMILDEKTEGNTLTLTYEVEGEHVYEQAKNVWIEDAEGKTYSPDNPPSRVEGSKNKYTVTFSSVNEVNSISICTSPFKDLNYIEDLAVTIDLK